MQNVAVIGGQWGDEGKGKIVDLITDRFDIVARFQGGPNAGHSVKINNRKFSLHHIPSGIFRENIKAVLGNGMVIDLDRLLKEMESLQAVGISLNDRLFISDRAHVILPIHRKLDELREFRMGESRIGTTRLGVGPAYQSKMARHGIRIIDLKNKDVLKEKIDALYRELGKSYRETFEGNPPKAEETFEECINVVAKIDKFICDISDFLNRKMQEGKRVLFEGAQGTMLDVDYGTYPFVTSSNSSAAGICAGLGISPKWVGGVIGVFKAYNTRVGSGPFPTEQMGETGEKIRNLGNEFGTTTGRPRRCGWFDSVAAKYAVRINGFNCMAITLLDVLSNFDEIPVCTKYRFRGKETDQFPSEPWILESVKPVYEFMEGWGKVISGLRDIEELPRNAKKYVQKIAALVGCEIGIISVGPERNQSIILKDSNLSKCL
ncbi:MAG: adenylosuccinate synthase [Acidobacteriota bacterium]